MPLNNKEGATAAEEDKFHRELKEGMDVNHMKLISLVKSADNPKNLPIYYNSDHNVVNIGGTGYDKAELVQKFNSEPGQSSDIKSLFYKADKSAEETVDMINGMNAGVKAELKYGYGNEPFVVYKKINALAEKAKPDFLDLDKDGDINQVQAVAHDPNKDDIPSIQITLTDTPEDSRNSPEGEFRISALYHSGSNGKMAILKDNPTLQKAVMALLQKEFQNTFRRVIHGVLGEPFGLKEEAKPDFLDLDKDGNTREPMKKAAKDKAVNKAMKKLKEAGATTYAGKASADDVKKDPNFTTLTGDAKIDVLDKLKKGGTVSLGEGDHYDYEGKMAHSQLLSIVKNSRDLFNMIGEDDQLKAWVQSKLTKAEDYLDAVKTYLEGKELSNSIHEDKK